MTCFGQAHADRGVSPVLKCLGTNCDHSSSSWDLHPAATRHDRQRPAPKKQRIALPSSEDQRDDHPVQFFNSQKNSYREKFTLLSLIKRHPTRADANLHFTAEMCNDNVDESHVSCGFALEEIAKALHVLFNPISMSSASSFVNSGSLITLEQGDRSLLRRFLHTIATGESIFSSQGNSGWSFQRERNASFVASDLIRTLKGGGYYGSPLKQVISDHLYVGNVSDALIQFFNFVGLSRSKKTLSLSSGDAVRDKIKQGWSVEGKRFGMLVGASDNMGLRRKRGWEQYTNLMLIFYSCEWMIEK